MKCKFNSNHECDGYYEGCTHCRNPERLEQMLIDFILHYSNKEKEIEEIKKELKEQNYGFEGF